MSNQKILVHIRRANEEDIPFIFNSWLKSFRNSLWARLVSNTIYFSEHHKILERIIKTSEIVVACNPDDKTQIYGYVAAERVDGIFVLHYVYVKQPYRNFGIAKKLVSSFDHDFKSAGTYTHHTRIAEKLAEKYNMIHHPYLLLNYEPEDELDVREETEDRA